MEREYLKKKYFLSNRAVIKEGKKLNSKLKIKA
jgi:hypothetical protein